MALKFRLRGLAETFIESITCPKCKQVGNDDQFFSTEFTKVTFDGIVVIVQCKNWSKHKVIHENHICQLFGTVIQYNIENNQKAIPVFITTTVLSETAMKFAEYLGIKVLQEKKFEDFPRIKCNINSKEKIYHLPFDQQYDKTIIDSKNGEFFAWTVQEAVDNGFRRAKKYFFSK